ncbi:unnamed protein product [Sphenostylis stenocarpa]|uniref:non-reducing end alpha-L-arabinofuranosidase n=1 Tax=Sphenostylis stenocarpa TaxID=92480 RepID=A0AA86VWD8_9FABA|nr:unnamed protein product [Sphenostylis stenocarpa]
MDENSFLEPKKVVPQTSSLEKADNFLWIYLVIGACFAFQGCAYANKTSTLVVDATDLSGRPIPDTLFGIFFEEINHAGAGGLWAELVNNRGFEAGGRQVPSNISPWTIVGKEPAIFLQTELNSCFEDNKVALKMDVLCDDCYSDGVGVSNPGFWGMNIVKGKKYKVVFFVKSKGSLHMTVSFRKTEGGRVLASSNVKSSASEVSKWKRMETTLEAHASCSKSSLYLTTTKKGVIWLDQVSAMPVDTYKRPGHFGDVWSYWTDDGFGYFEGLQLAEDIGARPLWVFNSGISHTDEIDTHVISPFVQEALDGIEFARGAATSKWGSLRASMGHLKPFDLKYVAVGNEDFSLQTYPTEHEIMFNNAHVFDKTPRNGPKAFVSEYALTGKKQAKHGTLLGGVSEAGFLIGLERNSDHVIMASYAPLFVNANDRKWNPDAIIFNSNQVYGTPSYWVQFMFRESNGATFLKSQLQTPHPNSVAASAILWKNSHDKRTYLKIKVANVGKNQINLKIYVKGIQSSNATKATKTVLTSANALDENSFADPKKSSSRCDVVSRLTFPRITTTTIPTR